MRSSLGPRPSSWDTSGRSLSRMPKPPRKFQRAQPQPAAFQAFRSDPHARQDGRVGRPFERAELADHEADALPLQLHPGLDLIPLEVRHVLIPRPPRVQSPCGHFLRKTG